MVVNIWNWDLYLFEIKNNCFQDVEGCNSYVDNLYNIDTAKCLDAVM